MVKLNLCIMIVLFYIDNQKLGDVINMGSYVSYYTKILISSVSKSHLDRFLKTCKDHCYKKPERKKIVVRVYRNGTMV